MGGTFPTLCRKTKRERSGWNQSGNGPLGKPALSGPGVCEGWVLGPGGAFQTARPSSITNQQESEQLALRLRTCQTPLGPLTFLAGLKAQWRDHHPETKQAAPAGGCDLT